MKEVFNRSRSNRSLKKKHWERLERLEISFHISSVPGVLRTIGNDWERLGTIGDFESHPSPQPDLNRRAEMRKNMSINSINELGATPAARDGHTI